MLEGEEFSLQVDLTEEELAVLKRMAKDRDLTVDEFISRILSKYCSY